MITYNPKEWVRFIFTVHTSDTIRKLFPLLIVIGLYTAGIAYLELKYLKLPQESPVKQITVMHSLLSFVISMLLVFRTNTAYDRWWEGRKLWGGLVNSSRNLSIKLNAILPPDDKADRSFFRRIIPMYAGILSNHLQSEKTRMALDVKDHPELERLDNQKHLPNQVAAIMFSRVNKLYRDQKITGDHLIILNAELQSFTDICGACERIKNTPIPYSYSAFIKKFIFIYVLTLPFSMVFSLGYLAIPVVVFIFYVLASLELVAEEIEDPFGEDENDLPTAKITEKITNGVQEILD
jgi:putative membrane protein